MLYILTSFPILSSSLRTYLRNEHCTNFINNSNSNSVIIVLHTNNKLLLFMIYIFIFVDAKDAKDAKDE